MDRETALAELRKAAEKIVNEAYKKALIRQLNIDCIELGIESVASNEDVETLLGFTQKLSSECFRYDKFSDLIERGQFIIPARTKEDLRQNSYKIKEECFDYWKLKQMVIDDMIGDVLSGEYDREMVLREIKKFNGFSVNDFIKREKEVVDVWLEELDIEKYLETVNQIFADENENRPTIKAENIPEDVLSIRRDKFYTLLSKYIKEKGYSETELRRKSGVSVAVYHNIRHMPKTSEYNPTKITVLALCIALHLTVPQTQELLGLLGYSLSANLQFDKIISWCLEQRKYDYDVGTINGVIFEITGRAPFTK